MKTAIQIRLAIIVTIVMHSWSLAWGQALNWNWATHLSSRSALRDACNDNDGNIYVTGYYGCGGWCGQFILDGLELPDFNNSGTDMFVAKYSSDGSCNWVRHAGGVNSRSDSGRAIAVDNEGNVYVAGNAEGNALNIGQISFGDTLFTALNHTPVFLVKYNYQGEFQWARKLGENHTENQIDQVNGLATDGNGNILLIGNINGGTGSTHNQNFIKFNSDGQILWQHEIVNSCIFTGTTIAVDTRNSILAAGWIKGLAHFGSHALYSAYPNVFIARFSPSGEVVWADKFGGAGIANSYTNVEELTTDSDVNIYVVGEFVETLTYQNCTLTTELGKSGYIMKLDSLGNFVWAQNLLGKATGVSISTEGTIAVTTQLNDSIGVVFMNSDGSSNQTEVVGKGYGGKIGLSSNGYGYLSGTLVDSLLLGNYHLLYSGSSSFYTGFFLANFQLNTTSVRSVDKVAKLSVFPNPVEKEMIVYSEERGAANLYIRDLAGRMLLSREIIFENSNSSVLVPILSIGSGAHLVSIVTTSSTFSEVVVFK